MTIGGTDWASATAIALGESSDPTPVAGFLAGDDQPYYSAWWKFTASADGYVQLHSMASTGDYPDTVLNVYSGTEAAAVLVASNDDAGSGGGSMVRITVIGGSEYHVRLGSYSSSTSPDLVSYVLTLLASQSLIPAHFAAFTTPQSTTSPPRSDNQYVLEPDISPTGQYIAGVMRGYNYVSDARAPGSDRTYEKDGIWIAKKVGNTAVTLLQKEFYDSSTLPTGTFPPALGYYTGYYIAGYPRFLSDGLVVQQLKCLFPGGQTRVNWVLISISGDTVSLGVPFVWPGFDVGPHGFGLPWQSSSSPRLIGDRAYMIIQTNISGYSNDFHLGSFAISGTTASDFQTTYLGNYYTMTEVHWWEDSVAVNITPDANVEGADVLRIYGLDGVQQHEYPSPTYVPGRIGSGVGVGDRVLWTATSHAGAEQYVDFTRLDVETGALGTSIILGETMSEDGVVLPDEVNGDSTHYIDSVFHVSNGVAVVLWTVTQDPYGDSWYKSNAIAVDSSNSDTLTLLGNARVFDPVMYDPLDVYYWPHQGPYFGPTYGILITRLPEDQNSYTYFFIPFSAEEPVITGAPDNVRRRFA